MRTCIWIGVLMFSFGMVKADGICDPEHRIEMGMKTFCANTLEAAFDEAANHAVWLQTRLAGLGVIMETISVYRQGESHCVTARFIACRNIGSGGVGGGGGPGVLEPPRKVDQLLNLLEQNGVMIYSVSEFGGELVIEVQVSTEERISLQIGLD